MSEIFKTFFQNKRTLLLIIGLGLIFSFLPLKTVEAACDWLNPLTWVECLTEGAVGIGEYIVTIPFRVAVFVFVLSFLLVAFLAGLLYALIVIITNWVIHISLLAGITPGGNLPTPEIVDIGWTFTRNFANMFFILIFVFIGLATILKLREYEAKKLLPKLIIIALLINFTPVIVGLIVDMGNIVTDFLIRRAGDISVLGFIVDVWIYLLGSLVTIWTSVGPVIEVIGVLLGIVIYAIVAIVFFLFASWVYFLVMLIFFLRIIELWILMILCPIAFLSYIFPPSKTVKMIFPSILHWDKWWEEFLQWVIVGIPLGFFLYLSNWLMNPANTPAIFADPAFQLEGVGAYTVGEYTWEGLGLQFASLITSILVPTVALVLLYKGYKIAKETAPEAAKGIIEGAGKIGQVAAAVGITAATMGAGAGMAAGTLGKIATGAKGMEASMGKVPIFGKALQYGVGKPMSWATKGMEMVARPTLEKYALLGEDAARKEGEEAKKRDVGGNLRALRWPTTNAAQKREILSTMIDQKQIGDALNEYVVGKSEVLSKEEILKAYENARKGGKKDIAEKFEQSFVKNDTIRTEMAKTIDRTTAKLAPNDQTGSVAGRPSGLSNSDVVDKTYTSFEQKIIGEAKTAEEIKRLEKGWWGNPKLMEAAQKFWGGPQLGKAADEFGRKFVDDYMAVAEARPKPVKWFLENNQKPLVYLTGNAAQDFGFRSIKGISRAEARELVERWRAKRTIPPGQTTFTP